MPSAKMTAILSRGDESSVDISNADVYMYVAWWRHQMETFSA